ncbi:MAG: glycosyltransferase family 4 protein [Candidatus Paceibacterales bacterium]
MKILMLTPYLPYPPSSGGQHRSINLIKKLSKKHEITLCSLIKYEEDKKYVRDLEPYCKKVYVFKRPEKPWTLVNILKTGFSSLPFLVIRNFSPTEKKALPKIIEEGNFDIIHAETFYVCPHIPETKIPIVLVDQTIEFQVYQHFVETFKIRPLRPMLYIDVLKLKFWEAYYWKRAARVIAVSERDASVMRQTVKGLKVTVNPNGVGEDLEEDSKLHFNTDLVFVGNYAWLQNIEAAKILAEEVLPIILKEIPKARLIIAGQNVEKVAFLKSDKVIIEDISNEDFGKVKKVCLASGVMVAPWYGPGGTRTKFLVAMAARLPVITTRVGIEGIDAVDHESVLIGETSEELAELTIKILKDKKLYQKIADNARKLIEDKYTYQSLADQLDQIYQQVVSSD